MVPGVPVLKDVEELVTLVGKEAHGEGPGIEMAAHKAALMVVGGLQLVVAKGRGDSGVVRGAQNAKQGRHTG